jgi:chromosome segregation ATPase
MAKINFTQDHFAQMQHLLLGMLMSNTTVTTKLGGELNVVELLHTTTINTLNSIRLSLSKHIENLESKDEWIADNASQEALDKAKAQKELVNLIIGYKRYMMEREETKRKKAALEAKLAELKESQKTPEDKIKELETELAGLDSTDF